MSDEVKKPRGRPRKQAAEAVKTVKADVEKVQKTLPVESEVFDAGSKLATLRTGVLDDYLPEELPPTRGEVIALLQARKKLTEVCLLHFYWHTGKYVNAMQKDLAKFSPDKKDIFAEVAKGLDCKVRHVKYLMEFYQKTDRADLEKLETAGVSWSAVKETFRIESVSQRQEMINGLIETKDAAVQQVKEKVDKLVNTRERKAKKGPAKKEEASLGQLRPDVFFRLREEAFKGFLLDLKEALGNSKQVISLMEDGNSTTEKEFSDARQAMRTIAGMVEEATPLLAKFAKVCRTEFLDDEADKA
jgi:hypothetical protein